MATESEHKEVYHIPPNYEDAGGLFGGRFTQRNGIEMAVVGSVLAFINFKWIFPNTTLKIGIIVAMLTIIPPLALCAFGINGESISQILVAWLRYTRRKRKLSYICFYDGTTVEIEQTDKKKSLFVRAQDDEPLDDEEEEEMAAVEMRTKRPREPIHTHILNSALKERLLRKLELGKDEDEEV